MKNHTLFRLLALTAAIAVVAIYYVLHPTEMGQNLVFISSVGLFAISIGYIFYGPFLTSQNRTNTARIGAIGITGFFSIAILFPISALSVYKAIEGDITVANALNIATIAVFFMQFFITRSSTNLLDEIDDASTFRSSHAQWGNRVLEIASTSKSIEIRNQLVMFSEEFKYLARDTSSSGSDLNASIDNLIHSLSAIVPSGNLKEIQVVIDGLKELMAARERQLKDLRNKV